MRLGFVFILIFAAFLWGGTHPVCADDGNGVTIRNLRRATSNSDNEHQTLKMQVEPKTMEADDQERGFNILRLSKIKNLWRKNPKSLLQKHPKVVQQIEKVQTNPNVAEEMKRVMDNPVTMKRVKSLEKHPEVIEAMRKAPIERSISKIESFVERDHTRSNAEYGGVAALIFFLALISLGWAFMP